jgi:hypothetical protein
VHRSRSRSYCTTGGQSVSMSWCRAPLGPMTRFYFSLSFAARLLCSSFCGALFDERTSLWFVVQSVSGQSRGGLITIHYCLIWDYWVPFLSPLTTRRDYGASILIRLHTGFWTLSIVMPLFVGERRRKLRGGSERHYRFWGGVIET